MKYIFLILALAVTSNVSQSQAIDLPDGMGFFVTKPSMDKIISKHEKLSKYSFEELNDPSKWSYLLTMSSIKLYLDQDSSLYYFNRALEFNKSATCKVMVITNNSYSNSRNEGDFLYGKSWFLTDLPDFDEKTFLDECDFKPKNINRLKSELELRIGNNDQYSRKHKNIDWEVQNKHDKMNRDLLDSLFAVSQSLAVYDKYEQDAFSMVLHHSADCKWNLKWFKIFLENKKADNLTGGHMIGPAFNRSLLDPKSPCYTYAKEQGFFEFLNINYPEYGELYGYNRIR